MNLTRQQFETEFIAVQPQLRSFLYRMTTDKELANDLAQDTFLRALKSLETFNGQSSLKTWLFTIGSNLAKDHFKVQKRFTDDAQDQCRTAAENPDTATEIYTAFSSLPEQYFELKQHVGFCFTCMAKTLTLEEQIALILADLYDFKRTEIAEILGKTESVVKHLLFEARKALQTKFEHRCAIVNKAGVCYQCAELSDHLNPNPDSAKQLGVLQMSVAANAQSSATTDVLYELRAALVKEIDPLEASNAPLHDTIMKILHKAVA